MWAGNNVIIVTAIPSFTHPTTNEVQVTLMGNVSFMCMAEGLPAVTYHWLYANDTGKL